MKTSPADVGLLLSEVFVSDEFVCTAKPQSLVKNKFASRGENMACACQRCTLGCA